MNKMFLVLRKYKYLLIVTFLVSCDNEMGMSKYMNNDIETESQSNSRYNNTCENKKSCCLIFSTFCLYAFTYTIDTIDTIDTFNNLKTISRNYSELKDENTNIDKIIDTINNSKTIAKSYPESKDEETSIDKIIDTFNNLKTISRNYSGLKVQKANVVEIKEIYCPKIG